MNKGLDLLDSADKKKCSNAFGLCISGLQCIRQEWIIISIADLCHSFKFSALVDIKSR